ncbi:pali-domain-containing protein [Fomitiporia mediterranea MF3/22]|uniref:pali-domain-containing protein n=1 Tax=Fomitiporia mediterranea (strain MF3/22) TaxID=694068 RepID=UPI0004407B4B|nr:pali-domain-containing protein [Fomitiporia mediterranea MF3/22]EJC98720.1 pali-domain-containing protein [Fomitiporia mediterranea MF3/22]
MIFRPATPGFIVTLIATILLAIVSFNVPIIKSVSFLQASLTVDNVNGTISLGTLGYCIDLATNGTTCSKPSVGYAFDANALLGDNIKFAQIPTVVVKWITYALFLHVIALCAAAISAFFGLLAHVREMSMTCCSSCISGFAAVIALVAFIFDLVLFFIVKARVKSLDGTATFGSAVWLTLAAWILLFFSGCVYACGRCCVRRRPRGSDGRMDNSWMGRFAANNPTADHAEQMRLDAVKAEADRKARQKNEIGLPAFPEHADVVRPLKQMDDGSEDDMASPYRDQTTTAAAVGRPMGARRQGSASTAGQGYRGGYAQAAPGTRAVDEYYTPSSPTRSSAAGSTGYPPTRRYSGASSNPQSVYHSAAPGAAAAGVAAGATAGYLAADNQNAHGRHPSAAAYGHTNSGTTYHTAASSQHQQYPSAYSQYDAYSHPQQATAYSTDAYNNQATVGAYGHSTSPPPRQPSQPYADPYYHSSTPPLPQTTATAYGDYSSNAYNSAAYGTSDPYNSSSNAYGNVGAAAATTAAAVGSSYQSPYHQQSQHTQDRSYTLGGGGYGVNTVPEESTSPTAYGAPVVSTSPPPMPTASTGLGAVGVGRTRSPQGQGLGQTHEGSYDDSPPGYESNAVHSVHVPDWNSKSGMR